MPLAEAQYPDGFKNDINIWITGPLPAAWGAAGAFPALSVLLVSSMSLTGSLPATWGQQGAFPALQDLQLGNSSQNGSLPPEWAGPAAFRQLSSLLLFSIGISGVHLRLTMSGTQSCNFGVITTHA